MKSAKAKKEEDMFVRTKKREEEIRELDRMKGREVIDEDKEDIGAGHYNR